MSNHMASDNFSWIDVGIVIAYFLAVIAVGIFASCRARRSTVSGYFLAGRSMMFYTVGASLFVSNIGSEHFIGLAGSGAAGGIGVGAWELNALLLLQLLGFVFVPVYVASQIYTMPEYLSRRFGGQRIRVYLAVLSLVLYIFTKCSVGLYTGALFIQQSLGWDLYLSIVILISIVAVLTITGGLTAVIYTDTLQAALMVFGALALMGKGFYEVGGFNGLWNKYPKAIPNVTVENTTCHEINPNWNIMLRSPSDHEMPWPGFLLGQTPGSIWYWCADQVIVQRALAAKSLSHAQGATLLAGMIKILPLFMMVMPGMMSRVLYPNEVACVDPNECYKYCQSYSGCTNIAYPRLVLGIMPIGAKGLMMAVMIAALMSDLDSIFNSASTLFTIDIYKRIRKNAGVKELMITGRLFVVVMVGAAIAWVPIVKETQGGQVFIYINEVTNYLAPPVASVFMLAILWPRCNEQGAFWGLMAGFVVGVIRLLLIFVYPAPEQCGRPDTRPSFLKDFHYMYYAMILFCVTAIVAVIVSLITEPPTYDQLYRTTFWSRFHKFNKEDIDKGRVKITWERTTCCFNAALPREVCTQTYDNMGVELESTDEFRLAGTRTSSIQCDLDYIELPPLNNYSSVEKKEESSEEPVSRSQYYKELLFNWFCGVGHGNLNEEENAKAVAKEEKICSLRQNKTAKLVLHILLLCVLALGVFLYCFFSLWRYEVPDSDFETTTTNYWSTLQSSTV